ncbi:MAG: hypothetical protein J6Y98_09775 [Bacteroidales bacterium]|nr:hypothetical protein [Bacteroidales bacterium]
MKNSTNKSTLLAIACFVALGIFATLTAHAQEDNPLISSPLVTTTGANVLGSGHLLLSGDVNASRFHSNYLHKDDSKLTTIGGGASLRWGIGSNAELTLGVSAGHAHGRVFDTLSFAPNRLNLVPSLGARIMLLGSEESKNKLTFFTEVTLPIRRGHPYVEDEGMLAEPIIGLQYRNRISNHWYFDASAAYAWNRHAPYVRMTDQPFRLTLFAHWLPNERWMFSAGLENSLENSQGRLEALWQTSDRLQLKAQMCIDGGISTAYSSSSIYGLIGFNWMIR